MLDALGTLDSSPSSKEYSIRTGSLILLALLVSSGSASAAARSHAQTLDRMMAALATESAQAAATIRRVYRDHLDLLFLQEYADLEAALSTGGLAVLPDDPARFNLLPRVEGLHPIGEKDLGNQASYVAARPATIGVLLEVASRVRSGPLEITSLVRHGEYQSALKVTNVNATTSVPMHTMGLAFDIALVNTPLKTVYEIRNVLRKMQRDGDILFIGERKQLVFHVVPHPSRLGHFTDVYTNALGAPAAAQDSVVVARLPRPATSRTRARSTREDTPRVVTEVIAVVPGDERSWAESQHAGREASAAAAEVQALSSNAGMSLALGVFTRSLLALLAAMAAAGYRIFAT